MPTVSRRVPTGDMSTMGDMSPCPYSGHRTLSPALRSRELALAMNQSAIENKKLGTILTPIPVSSGTSHWSRLQNSSGVVEKLASYFELERNGCVSTALVRWYSERKLKFDDIFVKKFSDDISRLVYF